MPEYIITSEYILQFLIAVVIVTVFVRMGRRYMIEPREVKAEFLTAPVTTSLNILILIIPLMIAAIGYSESKGFTKGMPTILTSISLLFICVLVALWINFTLLKKASITGNIILNYPKEDKEFVSSLGVIYGLMFFSFIYLGKYILYDFEMEKPTVTVTENTHQILVQRPAIFPGMSRDEVRTSWGAPHAIDSKTQVEVYKTGEQILQLQFDDANTLSSILIKKP